MTGKALDEIRLQYPEVNQAFWYAVRAHRGQYRKDGKTPYIVHPVEVAEIVTTLTQDPDVIAAALLHDVVEDTLVTMSDLVRVFGAHVAGLVEEETEDKREEQPPEETWEIRKQEMIMKIGAAGREAKMISLSDKLSNLRSIKSGIEESGEEFWMYFHQSDKDKQAWFYRAMGKQYAGLKKTDAGKQYEKLLKEIFG